MADLATLSIAVDSRGVVDATRDMDKMTASGSYAESMVKKLAAAFALFEIGKLVQETATLAARYETLGVAMRTAGLNIGLTTMEMDALQQSLQKTGISMIESRQSLTAMAAAHMDLAQSSKLARAAQDLAVVGGVNSSEAFARLVHGIQSGQTEILRTIGLNVQFDDSYKKLAGTLGKTVEQLTTAEKMQARTNIVLQQASGYAGIYEASMTTAGKQMLSMQRYSEDLKVKFGALFGPALSALVAGTTAGIREMSTALDEAGKNGNLQKIADTMGALAGGSISALGGSIAFLVDHLKALERALIAVAIASAYAWGPAGLAALGNIAGPLLSSLVGIVGVASNYVASATLATVATDAWAASLALLASPITAIVAGVGALVGAAMLYDRVAHGSIDAVEAQTKAMEAHIAKQKGWMSLREDALALEKKIKAFQADGGTVGPANTNLRVTELVKKATPEGGFDAGGLDAATRNAMKIVALQDQWNKMTQPKATPVAKVEMVDTEYGRELNRLQEELFNLTHSEAEAYAMKVKLMDNGAPGSTRQAEDLHRQVVEQQQANAVAEWSLGWLKKQEDAYTSLKASLDPTTEMLRKYSEAVALINSKTPEGAEKAKLLKAAYDTMTPSGIAAAKALDDAASESADLDKEAARMNIRNNSTAGLDHLNQLAAHGLAPNVYKEQLHKLELESETVWGAIAGTIESSAGRGADALTTFFNTGKNGFSDMVSSMLVDMEKLIIKQQVMSPLLSWATTGLSGLFNFSGAPDLSGYNGISLGGNSAASGGDSQWSSIGRTRANGGNIDGLGPYLVGEKGPEIFNPGRSGTITPNSALGGQVNNTSINVNVASNGQTDTKTQGANAVSMGKAIQVAVQQELIRQQRSGGILAGN